MVGAAWQNARLPKTVLAHEHAGQHRGRGADSGRWSGDNVMTFGTEVGRIGRWVDV